MRHSQRTYSGKSCPRKNFADFTTKELFATIRDGFQELHAEVWVPSPQKTGSVFNVWELPVDRMVDF